MLGSKIAKLNKLDPRAEYMFYVLLYFIPVLGMKSVDYFDNKYSFTMDNSDGLKLFNFFGIPLLWTFGIAYIAINF